MSGDGHRSRLKRLAAVLRQTGVELGRDDAAVWAAAISYYALLSVFPLLLAGVSLAAHFVSPAEATSRLTDALGNFLPPGARQAIRDTLTAAVEQRATAGIVSLVAFLWSGSRVFGTLTKALNLFFGAEESYGFWKQRLAELIMLLSVGVLFLLALASGFVFGLLLDTFRVLRVPDVLGQLVLRVGVPGGLLLLSFYLLYRHVPRTRTDARSCFGGALVATLLVLAARPLFGEYVTRFARYSLVYGPPAVLVVLLVWVWLVAMFTLVGAELASQLQRTSGRLATSRPEPPGA
jgi:membrane protein